MPKSFTAGCYRLKSLAWVTVAYLTALAAAVVVIVSAEFHPVIDTLLADIAATLVIFVFGRIFRNASFYDAYWSLAPIVIGLYWMLGINYADNLAWSQILIMTLVIIWGLRLTLNWASGWQGLRHEDWRYVYYRRKSGRLFWLVELVGIELVPTIVVFLGCLSLFPILTAENTSLSLLSAVGILVIVGAIALETIADLQLQRFVEKTADPGQIMQQGLWRYSRHPNYLGEIMFWWGLWLCVPGTDAWRWVALSGPLAVTVLFIFVSIPLMEKHNKARRTGYGEYTKQVPVLIPGLKKSTSIKTQPF
ncbi:MAG TPA: DUF1295 domain-containing protein [Dehalococcoidales bacterium]|nr:DUF1295 domain-containing protein [Dehalococcoidales bacterium]